MLSECSRLNQCHECAEFLDSCLDLSGDTPKVDIKRLVEGLLKLKAGEWIVSVQERLQAIREDVSLTNSEQEQAIKIVCGKCPEKGGE